MVRGALPLSIVYFAHRQFSASLFYPLLIVYFARHYHSRLVLTPIYRLPDIYPLFGLPARPLSIVDMALANASRPTTPMISRTANHLFKSQPAGHLDVTETHHSGKTELHQPCPVPFSRDETPGRVPTICATMLGGVSVTLGKTIRLRRNTRPNQDPVP